MIKLRLYVLLKYDLFKKRDTSHQQIIYAMLKFKSWIKVKIVYIQLKIIIKLLKYVSSCYTASERH